ncbi:MAG: hypothetical protein ACR2KJ_08895 [Jatrophihabitans sp.]
MPTAPSPDRFLNSIRVRRDEAGRVLDLRRTRFITPAAIAAVAAAALLAYRDGQPLTFVAPVDTAAAGYASRMGLSDILDDLGAIHDLPSAGGRRLAGHLVELTRIRSEADSDRLAELAHRQLSKQRPSQAVALHKSLAEIGGNVADHARSSGFLIAQTMPGRNELHLAVADAGVGLHATLVVRGARDDTDALDLALHGVSQFNRADRGTGIPETRRAVLAAGGRLYLASGRSSVRTGRRRTTPGHTDHPYAGVFVEARIPLP